MQVSEEITRKYLDASTFGSGFHVSDQLQECPKGSQLSLRGGVAHRIDWIRRSADPNFGISGIRPD